MKKVKLYVSLTKPGVLIGNVLSGAAGFLLASRGFFNLTLFVATIIGMTLVIASACVLNNYFDRDIDAIMLRTKKRAVASGKVRGRNAVIFSLFLGIVGILLLHFYTNLLVVGIGVFGFIVYVWLYGMFGKRLSVHGTLVGSVSGAMPIVAGYCAVTGTIDAGAILVFLILFFWQLPEFYSISVYRRDEYKAAHVPVISVVRGIPRAKLEILIYTIAFVISSMLLIVFGYTGFVYTAVMGVLGLYWIWIGTKLLHTTDNDFWARKMFKFSLVILLVFCAMLMLSPFLP